METIDEFCQVSIVCFSKWFYAARSQPASYSYHTARKNSVGENFAYQLFSTNFTTNTFPVAIGQQNIAVAGYHI